MDIGKADSENPGFVRYSSEVVDTSLETVMRFNKRVHEWAGRVGIKLGEGKVSVLERSGEGVMLYLYAPLASGDWSQIDPDITFPIDESCIYPCNTKLYE